MSVTVVEAAGSWREIGRAYGEQLRDQIQRAVDSYAEIAPRLGGSAAELRKRLAPFAAQAREHAPVRYAELQGMREGANIGLGDALLLNCVEELTPVEACTTAGKGGFLVHAEMWFTEQSGVGVLIATPDRGPPLVTASCVGFLTGVGASAAGFAQGVQSAFARDEGLGVPRALV